MTGDEEWWGGGGGGGGGVHFINGCSVTGGTGKNVCTITSVT